VSEVKITAKVNVLETTAVISFCLSVTTIIYFLINILKEKEIIWNQSNIFILSGCLLLTAIITNKWANYELRKLYKKKA